MPNVKCSECGKLVYRKLYLLKRVKRFCCSRKCRYQVPKRVEVRCATCGKAEIRFTSHAKARRIFCSHECLSRFNRSVIRCGWFECSNEFECHTSKHHGHTVYKRDFVQGADYTRFPLCSHHRDLLKRYGMRANGLHRIWNAPDKDWGSRAINAKGTRLVLFDRADGKCQACGKRLEFTAPSKTWIVDHIIPVYRGGKTCLNNLQVLCKRCDDAKTGKEKSEISKLRHHFGVTNGHRWLTHPEKDLLIASLEKERNELLARIASLTP